MAIRLASCLSQYRESSFPLLRLGCGREVNLEKITDPKTADCLLRFDWREPCICLFASQILFAWHTC